MDSGRLFRAVLTGITLLACIWALRGLQDRQASQVARPSDSDKTTAAGENEEAGLMPAVHVEALPLVALDNTCFRGGKRDLSQCTGTLSGAPASAYRFAAMDGDALYVNAIPRSEFFDLSVALMTADERCVAGFDANGPGVPEAGYLRDLAGGDYVLVVSGYGDDCGPYELTVRATAPDIAHVVDSETWRGPNGTVVRWGTFAEVDLSHFILYRMAGSARERVAVLRAHGSPAGFAKYRVMDRKHQPDSTYEIEAIASDGRVELVSITA